MFEPEGHISESPHRPLHWYVDQATYWITAATLNHVPRFRSCERLEMVCHELLGSAASWNVELVGWTVMENHYHAIVFPHDACSLPRFLGRLHGRTAIVVNGADNSPGRRVWRQYWDTVIRTEGDFWSRMNYMWWNPVRHGHCETPEAWRWTNLHSLMAAPEERIGREIARFPAPARLPGDVG
jgi:putative transposase